MTPPTTDWKIIDGLQRLTTLRQFIIEKSLRLTRLEFLDIEGAGFADLPRALQRRIEETPITVYFVQEGTPAEVTYNIFKRINTGGEALTAQEIRNAIYQGQPVRDAGAAGQVGCVPACNGQEYQAVTLLDHEVVLRYLAFLVTPEGKPRDNERHRFMNEAMERLGQMGPTERQRLEDQFYRTMNAAWSILGEYAFRKIMPSGQHGQISRALFDAWCRNFDDLTDENIKRLGQKRPSSRLLCPVQGTAGEG